MDTAYPADYIRNKSLHYFASYRREWESSLQRAVVAKQHLSTATIAAQNRDSDDQLV